MNSERLNLLFRYLKEEPNEPFHLYGIAMEYMTSDLDKAKEYLQNLYDSHPNYLPTYYQLGTVLIEHGDENQAISVLEKGIELAKKQHEINTLRELQSLYDELTF